MKIIGHIDADCFYVSCERVRDERLKNRPVAVLGNQGACVIARSYEIREFGVKVGMPIWEAKKLCPEGIYIKRDFKWYGILSKSMQDVLASFSDVIEYYSVDESFVDFGEKENDLGKLEVFAREIRDVMFRETGIPVSVGLSLTRVLSKVVAKKGKPFGAMAIIEDNLDDFLKTVLVEDVPGIGRKFTEKLNFIGVKTAFDFVLQPAKKIKKLLHKPGEEIWYELQGKSILPIRNKRPQRKFLSRGGSIWGHYKDKKYIWAFLVRNLERLLDALWKENLEIFFMEVILVTSKGFCLRHVQNLPDFTNCYPILLKYLQVVFEKVFVENVSFSAVHIVGGPLRSKKGKQMNLFYNEELKYENLIRAKKLANEKFGIFAVRSLSTGYAPEVFRDKTSDFEICDIEGKFCF